ncbi:oxidoreductase [Bdellovibrio bacteriovorus]|uniref:Oxidoreductase n=1 Tax=Bdellovibrio bacteriovorus TaxID=959 RepID=A0A150WJJ0_BDEBC|nr:SDR family NAD(P)-dependent oxidoreductase [Bdellovibrio bacteriovorus]KYG63793.1 oxidoreductase [Bdellovibrio bacteriovorus]
MAKKLAVITGASSGIGYELAKQFAQNGYDIFITSESPGIYNAELEFREFGTQVHVLEMDLRDSEGVELLYSRIKALNRPIDAIAINAGVGVGGASFSKTELHREIDMVKLNVISTIHLTKLVLNDMLAQKSGKILFTSSVAALMPGPYESVYAGTKSFILSFAEALRYEVQDKGVTITALLPGPTETGFFRRACMEDTIVGKSKKDHPARVAEQGFAALMRGDDICVAGSMMNKLQSFTARFLSYSAVTRMHGSMSKPTKAANR